MKRLFLSGLLAVLTGTAAFSQPAQSFINNGNLTTPQNIDALNFLNNGNIDFSLAVSIVDFSDVVNYTNKGSMTNLLGWIFDTQPTDDTAEGPAKVFVNTASGSITASTPTSRFEDVHGLPLSSPQLIAPVIKVWANNLTNQGILHAGAGGLLSLSGQNINLKNGLLAVDGVTSSASASAGGILILNPDGTITEINGFFPGLYQSGIYDTYWGVGSDKNQNDLSFDLPFLAQSGLFNETNSTLNGLIAIVSIQDVLDVFNPAVYSYQQMVNGDQSNIVTQVVLLGNGNLDTNTVMDVRFADPQFASSDSVAGPSDWKIPVIQWLSVPPSLPGLQVTNLLYLTDDFAVRTNGVNIVRTNSQTLSGRPGYAPTNYLFSRTYPLAVSFSNLLSANAPFFLSTLTNGFGRRNTNDYADYGVTLLPGTASPDPAHPFSNITNIPGRIEISAGNLDMTHTRMQGPNYIKIANSNNFLGSANSQISSPTLDIDLRRIDGVSFLVTNLVVPFLQQWSGTIDMYSCRFTNVFGGSTNVVGGVTNIIGNITNRYHILMVESSLSSIAASSVQSFSILATNSAVPNFLGKVFVSDVVNITSNLLIVADQVTITTNLPGSAAPTGQINLTSDIDWATSFPTLTKLTNNGQISFSGLGSFYGLRQPPYYSAFNTEPYQSMVNHSTIGASGVSIWATYFENVGNMPITNNAIAFPTNAIIVLTNTVSLPVIGLVLPTVTVEGAIFAYAGPVLLEAGTAILIDGEMASQTSDISLSANSLTVSNHALFAGGALSLIVSNQVNPSVDGSGRLATNYWQTAQGFNLPIFPSNPQAGDLLGTTLTSTVQSFQEVVNTWAGRDFGNTPSGYTNNMAIGHLILDAFGSIPTQITFLPATSGNALYVDLLELQDFATNRINPDLTLLNIDPDGVNAGVTNMVIYFADAQIKNSDGSFTDISEKLNHANNDRLRWVRSYNDGLFSSTNFAYPSGQVYQFNRALVLSTAIDSDGDGTPNFYDSTPFGSPIPITPFSGFTLSIVFTNQPSHTVLISWPATKGATNHLEFKSRLGDASWTGVFTTNSPVDGVVTVSQPTTNKANFYRLRVEPQQP